MPAIAVCPSQCPPPLWRVAPLVLLAAVATLAPATAAPTKPAAKKELPWQTNYQLAAAAAQKADKVLLVYFSGSDWDEWGQKLEKEVLRTDPFREWAERNVVPVQIDTPRDKKIGATLKAQNERLKAQFNIVKVPTFLFIDPSGEVLARVGYNTARLRDSEPAGQPKSWVEFCESVIQSRPPHEELVRQKDLSDAVDFCRRHAVPLLMLLTKDPSEFLVKEKQALLANQQFVRFVNRNLAFVELPWPADADKATEANFVRSFAAEWKIAPTPIQLVLWDPGGQGRVKDRLTAVAGNPQAVAVLVKRLDAELPNIDYNGGWVEDYKLARAIAHQQKKDLLLAFVSSDHSEWSQKMDREIFQTPEFRKYAKENLVLLRVDFPRAVAAGTTTPPPSTQPAQRSAPGVRQEMASAKDGSQPPALREQNRMLADLYGVRGYPTVIVLNTAGQKISEGKYVKGGAAPFLAELDRIRKADRNRRTLFSEQEAAK